ncbi:hypothetical protein TL16_g07260, partial [Triparma laevis f. inornata]
MFVFDFDRTLTNGMSRPGEEKDLRKVSALSPFFERGTPKELMVKDEQGNEIPLARGGSVFAADYQKAAALAQIIREQKQRSLRVFFFDDAIVNAHVVATSTKLHLNMSAPCPDVELISYWWDTFEEETGPTPSMKPSHTATTDSNYADFAKPMLADFGVTSEEVDARIEAYRAINMGTRSRRKAGEPVGGEELSKVQAAGKDMRAKMAPLAATLGARFARGPRPPPVLPNSSYNAFKTGKKLHNAELSEIRDAKKKGGGVKSIGGGLEGLLAARGLPRGLPRPAPPPASDWRAKAAKEKARADVAKKLFENKGVASLPPGDLENPRWETAFQVESPDEGSTGGLAFVATLAGAFAIKSANDMAEEYVGTKFLEAAWVPVPKMRVVFVGEEEHGLILQSVEEVAKQYSRRGDAEGAGRVMLHALTAMKKFDGPLILMELVECAFSLNELGRGGGAESVLEPGRGGRMARSRLDAIGRVWVLDAVLNFRDRFCSRLSYARYDEAVVGAEGEGEGKEFLTGNCDNVLFSPVGAGFAAIDSHVKLIREGGGVGAKKVAEGNNSELIERLHRELGRVLIEGTGCMEWLRFTVKVVGGWGLSDEALECVRVGAVRGMKAVQGAIEA